MTVKLKNKRNKKKCVIKKVFKFNDYKDCLLHNEIILKLQQRFKSEAHNMYTEEINKTSLHGIHTHPLGVNAFIVCQSELDHYLKHTKNEIILKSPQRFKSEARK